jgi:prepilin-type processing-associated H-X9-DG protein
MQYTQDYDERFPQQVAVNSTTLLDTQGYLGAIYPYTKSTQLYHCPSVPGPSSTEQTYPGNGMIFRPGGLNQAALGDSTYGVAGTIVVQEYKYSEAFSVIRPWGTSVASTLGQYWHNVGAAAPFVGIEEYANNHFDGGNLLFADGHVKWRKYTTLKSGEYGLLPDVAYSASNGGTNPCGTGTSCNAAF